MIYRYERSARRTSTFGLLVTIWVVLLGLTIWLDLAWFFGVIGVACTLPAWFDFMRNATAIVEVWPKRVVWSSSLRSGSAKDIDHVRLNRRYDGTMKITLIHVGGAQTRLPPDITPPVDVFEKALKEAGISVQRHPFSIVG